MNVSRRSFVEGLSACGTLALCGFVTKAEFPVRGLVAHRGDCDAYPENTLPAFRSAVAKGVEMIELDEWRCKTGELVVVHDHFVDRTTNGKGLIKDLTLAEIKALDAGSKKSIRFSGERVPTLEEALSVIPRSEVLVNIHCKTGSAAPEVARMLRQDHRAEQCILMCDSRGDLERLKASCPWTRTGLVAGKKAGWLSPWNEKDAWETIRYAVDVGTDFLQVLPNGHCTREQMKFLHDHGIRTTYYVADDAKAMEELVLEGHDFIFTNYLSKLEPIYRKAVAHACNI